MKPSKANVGAVALVVVGFLVVVALFAFVFPQFVSLFAGLGFDIPIPTRVYSGSAISRWPFVVALLFVVLVYGVFKHRSARKESR